MAVASESYAPSVLVSTERLPEKDWLEYRRRGIGGSDAAAILGISPFATARDLYYDKLKIVPFDDSESNWVAKKMGHLLEDLVAEIFHVKTGYRIYQIKKMFYHPVHTFMLADIDYFVELPGGRTAILEIKTTNYNAKDHWWSEDGQEIVPLNYEAQGRHYLNAYVQWPVIEYLVKAKLFRLVSDIVYGSYHFMIGKTVNCEGKNLQDVLKLDRSWLPLLQEVDPGIAQLNVIQWFIYAGKRPDASMMKWCANNAIQDVSVLAELLSHMTMHKLMRYADAQYEIRIASTKTPEYIRYYSMANLLADYRDYLRMCKEMQYNVESSFILFPRNLKSAHDHVVEALDVKRTAEQEKAIADSFEEWQRLYQYKGKDLMVIPPHSSKELIDEGTALRHCVGRYVKRVAQRECVILFVRKVAEPDKSLCTVEVRDGQVVQTRGFDNEDPPAKIKAFIERWKRQVLCAADKTAA